MKNILIKAVLFVGLMTNQTASGQVLTLRSPNSGYISSLALKESQIFAGTYGSGIFMYADNGVGWSSKNNGLREMYVLALTVKDSIIFAGTRSGVYISTNNGESWQVKSEGLTYVHISSFAIVDDKIFTGTLNGVFLSINNGDTWTPVSTGLGDMNVLCLTSNGENIFAGTAEGGVFVSNINTINWKAINTGITRYPVTSLSCSNNKIFAGTEADTYSGGLFSSDNSGSLWTECNDHIQDDIHCIAIKDNNIFVGTSEHGIKRSTFSDKRWTQLDKGLSEHVDIRSIVVNGNNIFIGSWGKGVFLSINNGNTWTPVSTGLGDKNVLCLTANGEDILDGQILDDKIADSILKQKIKTNPSFNLSFYERSYSRSDAILPKNGEISSELKLFLMAKDCNFYAAYVHYLQSYPNGLYSNQVKISLTALMYKKAKLAINWPDTVVYSSKSPYSNVGSPFWNLNIICKEIGGEIGYSVYKGDCYIMDYKGDKWTTNGYPVDIEDWIRHAPDFGKPNSSEVIETWIAGDKSCGGKYYQKCVIVDDAGNIENKYLVINLKCK